MPLIPRPSIGIGVGQRSARNVIVAGIVGLFLLLGVFAVFMRIARQVLASGSPLAPGVLFVGLGFAIALLYGITRDSSVALLVWMVAMVFGGLVGGQGLLAVDRVAFLALAGTFFIEVVSGRRELGRIGVTEFLMLCFVIYLIASSVAPHALPAVGEKGEHRSLLDLILTSAFLPFAGFFLARQILTTERNVRRFLWSITIFGVYLAMTNIFWILHLNAFIWPKTILDPSIGAHFDRGRGVFLNAAVTGLVLVVCFVVTMYLASQLRNRLRPVLLAAALLMLIGIGLTPDPLRLAGGRHRDPVLGCGLHRLPALVLPDPHRPRRARGGELVDVHVQGPHAGRRQLRQRDAGPPERRRDRPLGDPGEAHPRLGPRAVPRDQHGAPPRLGEHALEARLRHLPARHPDRHRRRAGADRPRPLARHHLLDGRRQPAGVEDAAARSGILSRNLAIVFWSIGIAWGVTASLIDVRLFAFANTLFFLFGGMCAGLADEFARQRAADEEDEDAIPAHDIVGLTSSPLLRRS